MKHASKKCKVCLDVMRSVRKRIPAIKEQFRDDELTLKKLDASIDTCTIHVEKY